MKRLDNRFTQREKGRIFMHKDAIKIAMLPVPKPKFRIASTA
jgi:hypothetical protein